ncbi:unnamed protein product, partial [Didymodactylos carnosus]
VSYQKEKTNPSAGKFTEYFTTKIINIVTESVENVKEFTDKLQKFQVSLPEYIRSSEMQTDPPAANSQATTTQYATAAATTSSSVIKRRRVAPCAPATFSQQLEIKSRSRSRSPSQKIDHTLENLNRSPVLDLAQQT